MFLHFIERWAPFRISFVAKIGPIAPEFTLIYWKSLKQVLHTALISLKIHTLNWGELSLILFLHPRTLATSCM